MAGKFTENLGVRAEAFEMLKTQGRSLSVSFDHDRLSEISQRESSGVGIRAVKQGKIGFSYSSKPDEIENVAASALRLAPYGKNYNFEFAGPSKANGERPFEPACGELDVNKLVETGKHVVERIKKIDPEATAACELGGGVSNSRLATSNGQDCSQHSSSFGFMVSARFTEEGNFVQVYRFRSGPSVADERQIIELADECANECHVARRIVPFKQGRYRVLLSPGAVRDILMPIVVSANGNNIARKTSRFTDTIGEKLFDERLTLIDDPFDQDSDDGAAWDGEGVPTSRRAIVEHGVLKGVYHTLATAKMSGHEPTGNARRSTDSQPSPGLFNLNMEPGESSLAELKAQAEGGICIRNMMGVFTSNFLAGQVSGNVSMGFLMEGGEYAGRVKNCALNINSFDALRDKIVGISAEREWAGLGKLPWLLLDDIAIASR